MPNAEPRVVVLTADVGEGHLAAARAIVDDLRSASPGARVTTLDALELLGPTMRVLLRDAYRVQLRRLPWLFALFFFLFLRLRMLRYGARMILAAFGARRMRSALEARQPDLVISTYPAASSVLGTLRRRQQLRVPACAIVTDFAGVEFWAHRGIDLHLVMHDSLVPLVEREAGAGSVRTVAPLVAASFHVPLSRADARQALDLPQDGRIVLVSGGGWGVGDLAGATAEAAALAGTTAVCLTGHNQPLYHDLKTLFEDTPNVRVLGFTHRMEMLLAATDVLVHTTGGVTCLEAMTVGCPIITFGPPAGHAPSLARAMARLGIAGYARSRDELRAALLTPPTPAPDLASSPAVQHLLSATCRRAPPGARTRPRVVAVAVASLVSAALLVFGGATGFDGIADSFDVGPPSVLPTKAPGVGPARRFAARRVGARPDSSANGSQLFPRAVWRITPSDLTDRPAG